jgi:lipoprotein-anchoring transpeptidase ErfK/SrfK
MLRVVSIVLCMFIAVFAARANDAVVMGSMSESVDGAGGGDISGALYSPGTDLEGEAKRKTAIVPFSRNLAIGDILVDTQARYLYLVTAERQALRYPVGVGREGYDWRGTNRVTSKKEWPDWRPPSAMIEREAARGNIIADFVKGGPGNPLGARALYIGTTEYRIHGTTQPNSIGRAVSSGCIRMLNAHVVDLYNRVKIGARVIVE